MNDEDMQCSETPVRDHLRSLPKDLVIKYERDKVSHNVPIGRIAHDAVALIDELRDFLASLQAKQEPGKNEELMEVLKKGLLAVAALIRESRGVQGLHMNGDLAPWREISTGGRFEDWLMPFDKAIAALSQENKGE